MTIDERIEKLTESQEKTQVMLADIVITLDRLARIAERLERVTVSNTMSIDELEARVAELEAKPKRRPQ
jgi:hypothetical protein